MRELLLVKANSRLGLKNFPFGGDADRNIGVENGPAAILAAGVFTKLPYRIVDLDFPAPETITTEDYLDQYAKLLQAGSAAIINQLKTGQILVNLGGDHSVAFMSLLTSINSRSNDIGYLQIDSHTDVHSLKTSPSGNFHGMWLRPFLAEVGVAAIDKLVSQKLQPENVVYVGNLVSEPEEISFLNKLKIKRIARSEIAPEREFLLKFIRQFKHLHVSIDVDAFDQTIAPGTGIKAEKGLFFEDIAFILPELTKLPSFSLDLVEFNPQKDKNDLTLKLIKQVVDTSFGC